MRIASIAAFIVGCGGAEAPGTEAAISSSTTTESTGAGVVSETGTTGPPNDPSTTAGPSNTGGGLSPTAVCEDYLACAAATIPSELGPLLETYGPEGTCWQSTQDVANQCDMACTVGLEQLQDAFADEPACGGSSSESGSTSSSDTAAGTGGQPDVGMYSSCTTSAECVGLDVCMTVDAPMGLVGFCSITGCGDAALDCDPSPGGTAVPACSSADLGGSPGLICALDCSSGESCPSPMQCRPLPDGSVCA